MFGFEKLEVWQRAIAFVDTVYRLTRNFPGGERFGLTNQMSRAAVSVSLSIAGGSARISRKDFARFIEIATGSLCEVISQAFIGRNQGFLPTGEFAAWYAANEEQSRMWSGLRRSLLDDA